MKGLLPCSRSGRCTENNIEEPQCFSAKKNHGGWRKDLEITLPQKKKNLETSSLSVYLCLAFARKYDTLGEVLSDKMGETNHPNYGTSPAKEPTPADYFGISSFLGISKWTRYWLDVSKNEQTFQNFTGNLVQFWVKPLFSQETTTFPKCADHNLGVTVAPNRSLPINDEGPGSPKTDQTACPLVDSGIWPTQIIPPRPATLFWSAGLDFQFEGIWDTPYNQSEPLAIISRGR